MDIPSYLLGKQAGGGAGGITIDDVIDITGELEDLDTTDKTNLVSAINEVAGGSSGSVPITTIGFNTMTLDDGEKINNWLTLCDFENNIIAPIRALDNSNNIFEGNLEKNINSNTYTGTIIIKFKKFITINSNTLSINSKDLNISLNNGISTNMNWSNAVNSVIILSAYNQSIMGVKTFNTLPISSIIPTTDTQLVNKKYVDDSIASAITTTLGGSF